MTPLGFAGTSSLRSHRCRPARGESRPGTTLPAGSRGRGTDRGRPRPVSTRSLRQLHRTQLDGNRHRHRAVCGADERLCCRRRQGPGARPRSLRPLPQARAAASGWPRPLRHCLSHGRARGAPGRRHGDPHEQAVRLATASAGRLKARPSGLGSQLLPTSASASASPASLR